MNDTEFLGKVKKSVLRKLDIEKRLNQLETDNPITYIKTRKERHYLKLQLTDVNNDIEILYLLYLLSLECDIRAEAK
ncbi:MAG: hypothetical protein IJ062_05315 [Firmicutes bacterium]|nr:hypothetical protein [Bacillota bacterium]